MLRRPHLAVFEVMLLVIVLLSHDNDVVVVEGAMAPCLDQYAARLGVTALPNVSIELLPELRDFAFC